MLQDSVPAGSYNDPFLSSVIPMVTPTWCHRANWGNPSWGQCRLTWIPNSHFNLVIRLSKVQQLALQLCTILRSPAGPAVPLIPTERISIEWSRAEHSETSYFAAAFAVTLHHFMSHVPGRHTTFRCGLFLLMVVWWGQIYCAPNSMELESCFMPIGARLDHGPGAGNNRTTSRKLGTESCFNFLWFHQLIPIGPLSHAFFPPQVGWLRRVLRCL